MSAYNATQVERLRQIGQYLQQARQERQLSLEEVSAHTRIQTRLLRALEAGDVAELPEPIYVQGFLRQYATLLELADLDLSELDLAPRLTKTAPVRGEVGSPLRPFHLYVTYFALILGAIAVLSYVLRPSNSSHSVAPAPSPTSVTPTPATPSSPVAVSPSPPVTPKPTELRVQVELTGQSWLQVVADGQVVFEGILNPGATETWTAQQTLVLAAGNAGEVRVRVNDGSPQPLGQPGEVKEVTLTLDNPTLPNPPR
ncbi:helix-turn-helix domain-containing protein [Trichothermofontia sp.]